jgi:hypothetical protein
MGKLIVSQGRCSHDIAAQRTYFSPETNEAKDAKARE